jgi:predicted nicotinamide N-methyase
VCYIQDAADWGSDMDQTHRRVDLILAADVMYSSEGSRKILLWRDWWPY